MQTELADVIRETLDIPINKRSRAYQAVHSHGKYTTGSMRHEACPQEPKQEASGQKPPNPKRCEVADRATVTLQATVPCHEYWFTPCPVREQQVRHWTLILVIYGLLHNIRTHLVTQSAAAGRLAACSARDHWYPKDSTSTRVDDISNEHLATAVSNEMCRDSVFLLI